MYGLAYITKLLKKDEQLTYFGKGRIKLSKQNVVYIESAEVPIGKVLTFGMFRANVYYYSEFMTTPCAVLLEEMEVTASMNAVRDGKAKTNLLH